MSFSNKVRKESLNKKNLKKIEKVSELCGIIKFGGTISLLRDEKINLAISTENPAVTRRIFSLYKSVFNKKLDIYFEKKSEKSRGLYTLFTKDDKTLKDDLIKLDIIEVKNNKINILYNIPDYVQESIENAKSYITGAFIMSGSMSDPERSYHVEFTTRILENAENFVKLLEKFSIKSSISERKNFYLCYIKESESISNLLNVIGAHQAMFDFEDIRIKKQMRNDVNRLVNCETSNLERVVKTAVRQIDSIKYLIENDQFDILDDNLQEIAMIRMQNPDMSLREIGESLDKPLSKSGVNHRLIKIEKIANNLREEQNANQKNHCK